MIEIAVASDFSTTPGARFRSDGRYSGEEFRDDFLLRHFADKAAREKVRIVLDGTEGYAVSFLEEAFGGLARIVGRKLCEERLEFVSKEDPLLIEEIRQYISEVP